MKLSKDWVLTELAGEYVAVPTAAASTFRGIVRLNDTGADIWNGLAEGKSEVEIADQLVREYSGLRSDKALQDVRDVIAKLQEEGLLEN